MTGLAVFTILKAGFVFSGKAGSGLVIARLPDGSWSAPSCIATAGVGWGLQIGAGTSRDTMGRWKELMLMTRPHGGCHRP